MPMPAFFIFFMFTFLEGDILSEVYIRAHSFTQEIFIESLLYANHC